MFLLAHCTTHVCAGVTQTLVCLAFSQGERTAEIGSGACSSWGVADEGTRTESSKKNGKGPSGVRHGTAKKVDQEEEEVVDLCESEEEAVVTVTEVGGFSR